MILSSESSSSVERIFRIAMSKSSPIIFPTDTIYGIGAFVDNIVANKKIFDIKNRPYNKPFPLLISSVDMMRDYTTEINDDIINCLNADTPTTVIVKVNDKLDRLFVKDSSVAFRVPSKGWIKKLILDYGCPLTATSVNESGSEFMNDFATIVDTFSGSVSFFIEGEVKCSSSRIVDLTQGKIKEIR